MKLNNEIKNPKWKNFFQHDANDIDCKHCKFQRAADSIPKEDFTVNESIIKDDGTVEIKDYIRDDARALYELLTALNSNEGNYQGKHRTIARILRKSRQLFFDSEDIEDDGKNVVGTLWVNVDEIELLEQLVEKPPEKVEVRGHVNETMMLIEDSYKDFKSEHPELFGKDEKDDKDADDSKPKATGSDKEESCTFQDRVKKNATKSQEVEDES